MGKGRFLLFTMTILFSCLNSIKVVKGQLIPDQTLGNESSVVNQNQTVKGVNGEMINSDIIEGGATRRNNLFHSFSEFNVEAGRGVYFANPIGINNILTRVTGVNPSNILGTLGVLGNADLFLINPNGIFFGSGASLHLNGSFVGSTANSILFDNFAFSASNPQAPPLLTSNLPIGLNFRERPGNINLQQSNLQVNQGQTLALIGGNITMVNSSVKSEQGRIELGGVAGEGLVNLIPTEKGWALGYQNMQNFGDIKLTQEAIADVSGNGGGEIQVYGKQVLVEAGSKILSQTKGDGKGGKIDVVADTLEIIGSDPDVENFSTLAATSTEGSMGGSGNVTITTRKLKTQDGGDISVTVFGDGEGGSIYIEASELIELKGAKNSSTPNEEGNENFSRSGLFAATEGRQKGGEIFISTKTLKISDGARISVSTRSKEGGNAGSITIDANYIELSGAKVVESSTTDNQVLRFRSGIFVGSGEQRPDIEVNEATGRGGNLEINAQQLIVKDGAQISSATFGKGNAGDITINATDYIKVSGFSEAVPESITVDGASSSHQVFSTIAGTSRGTGDSGNIIINTRELIVIDGGDLSVTTFDNGKGGNLEVNASEKIELRGAINSKVPDIDENGKKNNFSRSGFFASTEGRQSGGNLIIKTPQLIIADGARISVSARAKGNGGNITIEADEIKLSGIATFKSSTEPKSSNTFLRFRSGIFASSGEQRPDIPITDATGDGGNINITTNRLFVSQGAVISSATFGNGNAGDMTIDANYLEVTGFSQSISESFGVPVKNIEEITGESSRDIVFSTITAISSGTSGDNNPTNGNSGTIDIESNNLVISEGADISISILGTNNQGKSGSLTIKANQIELIGAGVNPNDPDNFSRSGVFAATEGTQDGGNLSIFTDTLIIKDGARISTSTRGSNGGNGGTITIKANEIEISVFFEDKPNNPDFLSGIVSSGGETRPDINREEATGNAGDILIEVGDLLLMRNQGTIATNAGVGGVNASGGNITIDSNFIVAYPLENSDITANSGGGSGGKIELGGIAIFGLDVNDKLTPKSDITAFSEQGAELNGLIIFSTPEIEIRDESRELPEEPNPDDLISANFCEQQGEDSKYEEIGTGGLPSNPNQVLRNDPVKVNSIEPPRADGIENEAVSVPQISEETEKTIIPARGWIKKEGIITLVSYSTDDRIPQRQKQNQPDCK